MTDLCFKKKGKLFLNLLKLMKSALMYVEKIIIIIILMPIPFYNLVKKRNILKFI